MKATKTNIKSAVRTYLETKNYTQFCKTFKAMGFVKRADIYDAIRSVYTNVYLRRFGLTAYKLAYTAQADLDKHPVPYNSDYGSFLAEMKSNKNAGPYKKILIEGEHYIWWASPEYLHKDYNKGIWRPNTEDNRKKMRIINAYLMKR